MGQRPDLNSVAKWMADLGFWPVCSSVCLHSASTFSCLDLDYSRKLREPSYITRFAKTNSMTINYWSSVILVINY